jgi:hypothetical protein
MMSSVMLVAVLSVAQDPVPPPNYAEHILPILRENCIDCHREGKANAMVLTSK